MKKILRVQPTRRPAKVDKSSRPRYHAASAIELKRWREAFAAVVKAYREASLQLRAGDWGAEFPDPCAHPFVPFPESMIVRARGQPA